MRILYLHQYFVPPQTAHGVTRSYEFARRLIANGHKVHMITSSAMLPAEYQDLRHTTETEIAGIPTTIIPVPYSTAMSFSERIRAFFRFALLASRQAIRHPADVVFATSTPLTIAVPGMAAHFLQRIPMVFEVRDLWPELPIALGALRNPFAKAAAHALEWAAYHTSSHVVALSPGMAEGVIRRGILAHRVTVIPNSCDIELFDVPPSRGEAIRARLGLRPGQPLVVYTGTFGLINGVTYLVELAAAARAVAPEMRFLLVGFGAEREKIVDRARELGVINETLWLWDPIPKVQMPDVLAAATVATSTVIPIKALWNNSANKFFDALAAGKPVAINYGGWQAEILEASGAGVVLPPDDPLRAARDLAAFVNDQDRLKRAAPAARALARERFSRDAMAQKLEAVLVRAAEGR
ncbi:MAG: glycosyltransferase family 4 protein [Anaerolineae bacterium]|nr:glycosyltransferase family 4 protein [Anaerolineae bacterium]